MKNKNNTLFIRCDVDEEAGLGHLMRCFAFGQAWKKRNGNVIIISNCEQKDIIRKIINEDFKFYKIQDKYPNKSDYDFTLEVIKNNSSNSAWVLLDGYHFDTKYHNYIKENGNFLIVFDDISHLNFYNADIILNQNINAPNIDYQCSPRTKLLLGSKYVVLRNDFIDFIRKDKNHRVKPTKILISLGGSDPFNFSLKLLKFFNDFDMDELEIKIVLGSFGNLQEYNKIKTELISHKIEILKIEPSEMPILMSWADIAITSGGSTIWELAYMGLPAFTICFATNQEKIIEILFQYGSVINLGWYNKIDSNAFIRIFNKIYLSANKRRKMSAVGKNLIDGSGGDRIIDEMNRIYKYN